MVLVEAFLLHFIYYFFLGPFMFIIGFFYWPWLRMMANFGFFGGGGVGFIIATLQWVINILILLSYFHWKIETIHISVVILAALGTGLRSSFIASKYSTYPAEYRRRYQHGYVTGQDSKFYLLGAYWGKQPYNFVEELIQHAIRRKYVDVSTFKMAFIEEPSEFLQTMLEQDLTNGGVDNVEISANKKEVTISDKTQTYYDARAILFHLIRYFNEETLIGKNYLPLFMLPGLIAAIFIALTPGFGRLDANLNFCGYDPIDIIMFFVAAFGNFFWMLVNVIGFAFAYRDYSRIDFCLKQLTQMYSVRKEVDIDEKIFPTINLADAISLQSWMNIRKLVFDYGINFHMRAKILYSVTLIVYAFCIALICSLDLFLKTQPMNEKVILVWLLFPFAIYFGFCFIILTRIGEEINLNYEDHTKAVRMNQTIYQTMHHFRDYYVKGNPDKELPMNINEVFTTETRSEAHKLIMSKVEDLVGTNKKQLDEYCEKLVAMQSEFIHEIDRESMFHSKTFLGFRINKAILGFVFVAVIVGLFYSYLYYQTILTN